MRRERSEKTVAEVCPGAKRPRSKRPLVQAELFRSRDISTVRAVACEFHPQHRRIAAVRGEEVES